MTIEDIAAPADEVSLERDEREAQDAWGPPRLADTGMLVIHGAGKHAPGSTLTEIIDPTLERLRAERTLVSVRPFRTEPNAIPGGPFDGIEIEYTRRAIPDHALPAEEDVRRAIIVEARWDTCFAEPPTPIVSAWAGTRVAPMCWELFWYHARSPYAFIVSISSIVLLCIALSLGATTSPHLGWSRWLFIAGMGIPFIAALIDSSLAWLHDWRRGAHTGVWWVIPPMVPLAVYHVQRGIVLVVAFTGMFALPALVLAVRFLGTIPGLDGVARHTISTFERWALGHDATDVEVISHDYVTASAIQGRVRAGLRELQKGLLSGSNVTVLAHSAGAILAWWLLSEPGIHEEQLVTPFQYRLITVGAALNWAQHGMSCDATFLGWPLTTTPEPGASALPDPLRLATDRADGTGRTAWLNVYSSWDPCPHGPIHTADYGGTWQVFEEGANSSFDPGAGSIANEAAPVPGRRDPNVMTRNLGSPISAEHSEYFRNQQEFVPLLVHAMDPEIEWLADEIDPARREQWSNLRLALISALVRVRLVVFSLPVAYVLNRPNAVSSDPVCGNRAAGALLKYFNAPDCTGLHIPRG